MPRKSQASAPVPDPVGPLGRGGNPRKGPLHDGPAGDGAVKWSKFAKESRDPVPPAEKEPGKSRGRGV